MGAIHTLVLHSGGLRSLVATALAVADAGAPAKVALLHLVDLRAHAAPGAATRLEHARRQAEHFKIKRLIELERPAVEPLGSDPERRTPRATPSSMRDGHALALAVAQALELGAARVVWPCSFNADAALVARATELAALSAHLAHADAGLASTAPTTTAAAAVATATEDLAVETPLAELTDRQVIEVGAHLDVPWKLAWSCVTPVNGEAGACRACTGCRRRDAAFDAAGMVDPFFDPAGGRTA